MFYLFCKILNKQLSKIKMKLEPIPFINLSCHRMLLILNRTIIWKNDIFRQFCLLILFHLGVMKSNTK